jgi:flagellar protein FliJ
MFKFSLQRVLDYRRQMREKMENEIATISANIESEKSTLNSLKKEIESHDKKIGERGKKGEIDLFHICLIINYIKNLKNRIVEHDGRLQQLIRSKEQKRSELIKALEQEQVMEKLKEKEKLKFLEMLGHAERLFLDEIAIRGYIDERFK